MDQFCPMIIVICVQTKPQEIKMVKTNENVCISGPRVTNFVYNVKLGERYRDYIKMATAMAQYWAVVKGKNIQYCEAFLKMTANGINISVKAILIIHLQQANKLNDLVSFVLPEY